MTTETKEQTVFDVQDPAATTAMVRAEQPTPMMLLQQAIEHNVDVDRVEKLMDLQERWERNEAGKRYAEALAAFQAECQPIHKRREASFNGRLAYTFASLDDIMVVIQPLLTKHGLAIGFSAGVNDAGALVAQCRVRCGTHVEVTDITLPVPAEMKVNATQKMGAALSYAKRYALCAALNITVTDEDNDGNGLIETVTEEEAIQLQDIASECPKGTRARCLAWLGVSSFYECPAAKFYEVRDMLKRKQQEARR